MGLYNLLHPRQVGGSGGKPTRAAEWQGILLLVVIVSCQWYLRCISCLASEPFGREVRYQWARVDSGTVGQARDWAFE